ncbi:E3 SUMO-protein ligase NSE2-like [Schistocerca gregaria]|uniref:E3 SUMO-protein ligase NSE2-like n=1 Tax=Schistocerca gregaria TaxID=7010 RepID=UPI00211EA9D6|nr:E3 SUMO-protein ligase NSE2-like [Schistocerca gregaria]
MADSNELRALESRQEFFISELEDHMNMCIELTPYFIQFKEKDKVKQLRNYIVQDIKHEHVLKTNIGAIDFLLKNNMLDDPDRLVNNFEKFISEQPKQRISEHEAYKEFNSIVLSENGPDESMMIEDGEDGICMLSATDNLICPLSRQQLRIPMKNQECGHVYSRDSIEEYLRKNGKQCPVAGCNARISSRTLCFDEFTAKKLTKKRKKEQIDENVKDI